MEHARAGVCFPPFLATAAAAADARRGFVCARLLAVRSDSYLRVGVALLNIKLMPLLRCRLSSSLHWPMVMACMQNSRRWFHRSLLYRSSVVCTLYPFQIIYYFNFIIRQTCLVLIKFIKEPTSSNIYNIKLVFIKFTMIYIYILIIFIQ